MCPNEIVIKGPGATLHCSLKPIKLTLFYQIQNILTIMWTVDLAQKVTLFLFWSVGNCVDPNFVGVMICY